MGTATAAAAAEDPVQANVLAAAASAAPWGGGSSSSCRGSDAEYVSALMAGSGKMQLLDCLLEEMHAQGRQVLVLAHSAKVSHVTMT
jgi:primosomal protein N'